MPRMKVLLDGVTYVGQSTEDTTLENGVEAIYEHVNELNRLKLPLEDGSVLILRKEHMQRAVLFIEPSPATSTPEPT